MAQHQLLRDHSAHRHAVDMGAGDAEVVEQPGGVVGHLHDGVRSRRLVASPGAAVVVVDGAKAAQNGNDPSHASPGMP